MPYTPGMPFRESTSESARPPQPSDTSLWGRLSEGRRIDELWSQFTADTRSSYGFYVKDVDWDEINKLPRWHRPLHVARAMFAAMLYKLSAVRRVLLLIALGFLVFSGFQVGFCRQCTLAGRLVMIAAL